jgi:hypothetical protein
VTAELGPDRPRRGPAGIPLVALFTLLGFELGVLGAFLVPVVLPGGVPGLAVAVAVVGNVLAGLLARRAVGTRLAALAPAAGWAVAAFLASLQMPNSSVVVPASVPGVRFSGWVSAGFLLLGSLAALAPLGRRPRRG